MTSFDRILLRLKERLGVQTDKEIAKLLGMSDKAFNARKKRDAFPQDKLFAMMTRRQDIDLDLEYVLTGSSPETEERGRRLDAVSKGGKVAKKVRGLTSEQHGAVQSEAALAVINSLKEDEQLLLGNYRRCTNEQQDLIRSTAANFAATARPHRKPKN